MLPEQQTDDDDMAITFFCLPHFSYFCTIVFIHLSDK